MKEKELKIESVLKGRKYFERNSFYLLLAGVDSEKDCDDILSILFASWQCSLYMKKEKNQQKGGNVRRISSPVPGLPPPR